MTSSAERRDGNRVRFDHGFECRIMAIDATWQRACTMKDASNSGAKLIVTGSLQGLQLKEFFLVLSPTGLAYRRCELVWLNGEEIGVRFLRQRGERQSRSGKALPQPNPQ
ncbi:MAG: PilZ domain-containing protein [Bradyrhizobium sp.]|nr:PilZ domain-containing protein [Bradyrhizobium sp.]